jgi:hypothetical protein
MNCRAFQILSLLVAVALQAIGGSVVAQDGPPGTPSSDLSAAVDHPLVPLITIPSKIFAGEEVDEETWQRIRIRVEETVRPHAEQVAGIDVTIVDVADYHNGALHDTTADYFAQGVDGTVYYLGERVNEYEHGTIVNHEGTWLSGESGYLPGVFMPADPVVGDTFAPEHASDTVVEQSTVIAVEQSITTVAGTFERCVVMKEISFPKGATEEKTYCPGIGLVREESTRGQLVLVAFTTAADTTF